VVLTPWYEYSAFGRSDSFPVIFNGAIIGSAYEPDSRTHQYGANIGVRLFF
jgi:hypothetical protein